MVERRSLVGSHSHETLTQFVILHATGFVLFYLNSRYTCIVSLRSFTSHCSKFSPVVAALSSCIRWRLRCCGTVECITDHNSEALWWCCAGLLLMRTSHHYSVIYWSSRYRHITWGYHLTRPCSCGDLHLFSPNNSECHIYCLTLGGKWHEMFDHKDTLLSSVGETIFGERDQRCVRLAKLPQDSFFNPLTRRVS